MDTQKKEIFEEAGFKCKKCGYFSPLGEGLELSKTNNIVLCSICNTFAPLERDKLHEYIHQKIDWQALETFRNSGTNKASHSVHKQAMIEKSRKGFLVARPPFGYRAVEGNLIPDEENMENVRLIFKEFLEGRSLNQLSQTYRISVNGIKKILKNFSYLGKVKFNGQIIQGKHQPIISHELFNSVQNKFDKKNFN
jgi:hypothetical protein